MARREISAGGVVFQKKDGEVLWLITQPKREKKKKPHWRLPKGIIEKDESSEEAAVREVEEETGVKAKVLEKVGETTYFYTFKGEKIFKIILFYLMKFLEENGKGVDKVEIEQIEWLSFDEACERLTFDSEKGILEKAKKILKEKENQLELL